MAMAVVVPFAFLASASGAAAPPIDVANDHVTCNTINKGVIKINPPLTPSGSGKAATVTVSGKLAGCSDSDNAGVTFPDFKSSFKGTIALSNDSTCADLFAPIQSGTLNVKWIADQKLTPSSSVITLSPGSLTVGIFDAPWGAHYAAFAVGDTDFATPGSPGDPVAVSGAFTGGDGGATSTVDVVSQEDFDNFIQSRCFFNNEGLKTLNIGLGQLHLG
jgi:hypothetical protein